MIQLKNGKYYTEKIGAQWDGEWSMNSLSLTDPYDPFDFNDPRS
jgi:hypothetical protein